jgi:hypothetical protein
MELKRNGSDRLDVGMGRPSRSILRDWFQSRIKFMRDITSLLVQDYD